MSTIHFSSDSSKEYYFCSIEAAEKFAQTSRPIDVISLFNIGTKPAKFQYMIAVCKSIGQKVFTQKNAPIVQETLKRCFSLSASPSDEKRTVFWVDLIAGFLNKEDTHELGFSLLEEKYSEEIENNVNQAPKLPESVAKKLANSSNQDVKKYFSGAFRYCKKVNCIQLFCFDVFNCLCRESRDSLFIDLFNTIPKNGAHHILGKNVVTLAVHYGLFRFLSDFCFFLEQQYEGAIAQEKPSFLSYHELLDTIFRFQSKEFTEKFFKSFNLDNNIKTACFVKCIRKMFQNPAFQDTMCILADRYPGKMIGWFEEKFQHISNTFSEALLFGMLSDESNFLTPLQASVTSLDDVKNQYWRLRKIALCPEKEIDDLYLNPDIVIEKYLHKSERESIEKLSNQDRSELFCILNQLAVANLPLISKYFSCLCDEMEFTMQVDKSINLSTIKDPIIVDFLKELDAVKMFNNTNNPSTLHFVLWFRAQQVDKNKSFELLLSASDHGSQDTPTSVEELSTPSHLGKRAYPFEEKKKDPKKPAPLSNEQNGIER